MEDFFNLIEDMELVDFQLEGGTILGLKELRLMLPLEFREFLYLKGGMTASGKPNRLGGRDWFLITI